MVALENAELDKLAAIDESIKIDEDNVWICDFRVGDVVTLEQALYGAIVNSGNDAAIIVATTVAGSVSAFSDLMNKRALEIGATNSHFVNPHGLTNEQHYTTAYDLYLIFNEAIKNDEFVKIASTVKYSTSFTRGKYTIVPTWTNGNQFINGNVSAPTGINVICGKTGYTEAAGYCLVILSAPNPLPSQRFNQFSEMAFIAFVNKEAISTKINGTAIQIIMKANTCATVIESVTAGQSFSAKEAYKAFAASKPTINPKIEAN